MSTQLDFTHSKLAITIPEAGKLIGLNKSASYAAAKRKDIPTVKIGRFLMVPVADLERKFGKTEPVAAIDPEALAKAIVSEFFARLAERMTR
jgi:hypothetical protein